MDKKLKIINVNKRYKLDNHQSFQALFDINVEFEKGELVSIVGESGSGKSTLMNLIGGLDSDFTGDIIADGENLRTLSDKELDKYRKNKVGFVFQSFNLISHLSILDNVTLSLTLSNINEKEKVQRATEILKRVGLEDQLKKKPTQLSGGQKQRVAIARALINDPEIIIADEPTGALDSGTSMQILEILKEIADSGKLVIMVTHSEKVASISSRVVEISDGRIVNDRKNEGYKKNKSIFKEEKSKKNNKSSKEKQTLTLWQAIRLSFHNMWASKTKNILMSIGVGIGVGSLILMMCFSSGIPDFISDTMASYSNPEIVTISKKRENDKFGSLTAFNRFVDAEEGEESEEDYIIKEINSRLEEDNIDFTVVKGENTAYGFSMFTLEPLVIDAKVTYTPEDGGETLSESIYLIYTIPPYYNESAVSEGTLSTTPTILENGNVKYGLDGYPENGGGIMFSKAIYEMFEDKDAVGKSVTVSFIPGTTDSSQKPDEEQEPFKIPDKICGIMDTSVFSGILAVYIDYDYLKGLFATNGFEDMFAPTSIYIRTPSQKITDKINGYLKDIKGFEEGIIYSGSIEDSLSGMFNSMTSTIGTSLVVISSISLIVSAMMILVVLYMSVTERTKEIGVLKSIGARRKDIKRIFTSESFLIGILSGLVGIIFNLILTLVVWLILVNTIGLAPISYRWWYFAVAMAVAICISMLSGLYPASKAAKLDPVESLRRE